VPKLETQSVGEIQNLLTSKTLTRVAVNSVHGRALMNSLTDSTDTRKSFKYTLSHTIHR